MRFKLCLNCNGNKDSILNNQKGKCHCIWSEVSLWNSCSTLCKLSDKSILGRNVGDYLHFIYRNELEVKDTIDANKSASDFVIHLAIDSRGKLKTKLYVKCDYLTFLVSTSISSVAIFQHHQRMEITSHNSYVALRLVPRTMIF